MINSIFSLIASRFPDHQAVVHNKKSITYGEINHVSDRLSYEIEKLCSIRDINVNIKNVAGIAIYMPVCVEAIVSMLGILKAGRAYLFLDIADPFSRTRNILEDAEPEILITFDRYRTKFKGSNVKLLIADNLSDLCDNIDIIEKENSRFGKGSLMEGTRTSYSEKDEASFNPFAYIIYTSGSTGKPKGIPIRHRSVINLLDDFQQRSPLDNNDKCSLWTNLNFDVSVYEIWSALLYGATLFIPDNNARTDSEKFIQWLKDNAITSSYIPPFMISELAVNQAKAPVLFKRILTGVEPIPEMLLSDIKRNTPGLCLINGYGPAEATVCATLYDVPDYPANPGNAPIGKPVKNLEVYLLDELGNPVKEGEKGEIHIAGIQVADGYLNNPSLSERSFIKNPFSEDLPGLMYKTGDMGKRLKTGDIMFAGRKDFQIKLRGFRIEPGEIENTIKEFPGISQAAVVLKENKSNRKILTAYIDSAPDTKELMEFLKDRLPRYMVPSAILYIENMPLTPNDKIDKINLIQRQDLDVLDQELPISDTEKKIAEIWEHFLGIHPVYRNDDFLLLGGDSILGVKILSRVNALFLTDVDINTFFEHSELKHFAKLFDNRRTKQVDIGGKTSDIISEHISNESSYTSDQSLSEKDSNVPLLDDQNLIWMFENINPGTCIYHIPLVYNIIGELDYQLLKRSVGIMVKEHIALRSVFLVKDNLVIQRGNHNNNRSAITSSYDLKGLIHYEIEHIDDLGNMHFDDNGANINLNNGKNSDYDSIKDKWIYEKVTEHFDLETGPVFRTDILITGRSACILCFCFHHIIFDGWSAGLFIKELGSIYNRLLRNDTINISEPEFSFHDYIPIRLEEIEQSWKSAKLFFIDYLKGIPSNSHKASVNWSGACSPVRIDGRIYNKIKEIALKYKTTSFTILLSLFQILLFSETGKNDQVTGVAYANRDNIKAENIIGFLMNTIVVRNIINVNHEFKEFLNKVKQSIEKVFLYKNIPFHRVNHLCQEMGLCEQVFDSMFLMQTMEFPPLDFNEARAEYMHVDMGKANCSITLELFEKESGLNGWFEYKTDVFNRDEIEGFTKHFYQIIDSAINDPSLKITNFIHLNSFPLSPMQHSMIMETLRSPQGAGSYIEQIVFDINMEIDIKRFSKAWEKVIDHHEVMRLGFAWKNLDQPMQYISTLDRIDIEINDWSRISKSEQDEFLEMFLRADRRLGFSLSKPPLFRIALLKIGKTRYKCVWSFHHAIADGRSMVFILKDLFTVYHNMDAKLTPIEPFRHYIQWLDSHKERSEAEKFWTDQLKGFTEAIDLPFNLQKKSVLNNRRQEYSIAITTGNKQAIVDRETTSALKIICDKNSITMNSLLMGAWAVLLSHYTGKNDILFGSTISVRHWREHGTNDTGLYINTIPIRIEVNPEENLTNFFNFIRTKWLELRKFEYNSLVDIHRWSEIKGGNPLFNIFFSYDYNSIDTALEEHKKKISCSNVFLLERTPASLFLTISGINELSVTIEYDQRRFTSQIIKQILVHYINLLNRIAEVAGEDSMHKLMDIPILTDIEQRTIFQKLNTDKIHLKPDSCIHHLIEIQASVNKKAIAIKDRQVNFTYAELNEFANRIAHYLIQSGAGPEKKILIMLEQNANLIAVILGVLKSGAAYIPVDPDYPEERINYIIKDSEPEIIITSELHAHRISPGKAALILLDKDMAEIRAMKAANPETEVDPENIAYIIYTSGSTGKPKGVMIEHSCLVAFTRSASEIYNIMPDDRVLQFASISFDASAEEIFPTLFSGATLVMKPREIIHTPSEFIDFCIQNNLSVLDLPTSYWHMIVDELDSIIIPENIRLIIIGGDEANPDKIEKWNKNINSDIRLINTYGPTETTVAVTWADLSRVHAYKDGKVSIGLPFPNVSLCILNQFYQPSIFGTRGELYIGGTQTGRGYLNREALNAKSFVKFDKINSETVFFKTGDSVELIPENGIIFYGRIDRQIKIRGFRVEPGEIEQTAVLHSKVADCAVVVSKNNDRDINFAAFIVPDQDYKDSFSIKEFKAWLLTKIPEYMVPPLLIVKDSLPYTPSGKIDYNALKIPQRSGYTSLSDSDEKADIELFNSPYEKSLKEIWEDILNLEVTDPDDVFFDIGGSSLYAIKLVSAIEKKFRISIPVIAVFKSPTIRQLAKIIEKEVRLSKLNPKRLINEKGKRTPIILVGNSVGAASAYKKADLKGHPFYHAPIFIHFYSEKNSETISLDIWQLAQKCINDITHFFPSGPYIIMGECLNSLVAHEVACQLTNMNKEVELLVILDDNWDKKETISDDNATKHRILSFIAKQIKEIHEFGIMHIFKKIMLRIKYKIRFYYASLDKVRERFYNAIGRPVPESVQFRLMESVFYRACEANPYMPIPYYGRVLMFYSKGWVEQYDPKLRTYYKGQVKQIDVDARHSDWFQPKQIETIINEIEKASEDFHE